MKNLILAGILSLFCVIPITSAQAHGSHGKPNYAYKEKNHNNAHKKHYNHGHKKNAKKYVKQTYKHHNNHNAHKKYYTEYVYINGHYYDKRYVKQHHHGHHSKPIERNFIEILFGF